jgi:hypothetical protein
MPQALMTLEQELERRLNWLLGLSWAGMGVNGIEWSGGSRNAIRKRLLAIVFYAPLSLMKRLPRGPGSRCGLAK